VSDRVTASQWPSWPARALLVILAALVALGAIPSASPAAQPAAAQETPGEEVIVVLADGEDPIAAAHQMGVTEITHVYRHVFTGFSGFMPASAVAMASRSRSTRSISPDGEVTAEGQVIPTGVARIGTPQQSDGDHLDIPSPVDADIAIVDTGVTQRSDLNVAGGTSCVSDKQDSKKHKNNKKHKKHKGKKRNGGKNKHKSKQKKKQQKQKDKKRNKKDHKNKHKPKWKDDNGHGTHVAGIAAAIDNDQDVVGVAPGARIWGVKVLDEKGAGRFSDVICGLDWVVEHKATIDVVNLSLSGPGSDGTCTSSAFHRAICSVVDAGIPVVVAAGNQSTDASTRVPASFDEVITVSGISDSDGEPGGDGGRTCFGFQDDTFLEFSNFGPDIDIAAPGDCILSLSNRGDTHRESGTSEASPHVAGAIADFVAQQIAATGERPTPDESKAWLLTEAAKPQDSPEGFTGDPDEFPEPILWLGNVFASSG
jgi:subtilisin family serine protease